MSPDHETNRRRSACFPCEAGTCQPAARSSVAWRWSEAGILIAVGTVGIRPRFTPAGLMVFEDTSSTDTMSLRYVGRPWNGLTIAMSPASRDALIDGMCRRVHERQHYRQHTDSPLALLLLRLRKIKRDAARDVLSAMIEATGTFDRLDVLELRQSVSQQGAGVAPDLPPGLSTEAETALWVWSMTGMLEGSLLGDLALREDLRRAWDASMVAPVAHAFVMGCAGGFIPDLQLQADGPGQFAHADGNTTVRDLFEGQARFAELDLMIAYFGPEGARQRLRDTTDITLMQAPIHAAKRLSLPLYNVVTLALLDLSLQQMPDPELLADSDIKLISWEAVYPGRFFDAALELLAKVQIPRRMTDEDAYEFVSQVTSGLGDPAAREAMADFAGRLPTVEQSLARRQSLSEDMTPERRLVRAGSGLLVDAFVGETVAAALRGRADTPALMCLDEAQADPDTQRQLSGLRLPPFVVTPIGLETYPVVNAEPGEHLPLFADCVADLCIDEMAATGRVASTAVVLRAAMRRSGGPFVAVALELVAQCLGPMLGGVAKQLISEVLSRDA